MEVRINEKMLLAGLVALVLIVNGVNFMNVNALQAKIVQLKAQPVIAPTGSGIQSLPVKPSLISFADFAPSGIPRIYGAELGIKYDDISATDNAKADATIRKLAGFDDGITLSGDLMTRYIAVAGKISCEYCCGVETIIFPDGKAACGCAHSYAMRGVAKYILKYHAKEFTDAEILEELGKWKTLFFPGPMTAKAEVMKVKGMPFSFSDLGSNKFRGLETQAQTTSAPNSAGNAGQVGGC